MSRELHIVGFQVGRETYGVPITSLHEIVRVPEITAVPDAPDYLEGVINLRGVIVPIFDLRAQFGLDLTVPTSMHVVIIVSAGTRTIGLLVDTVSDIISVDPKAIRPVPEMGLAAEDQFFEGLVAIDARMVTLVSLAGLFGSPAHTSKRNYKTEPAPKAA